MAITTYAELQAAAANWLVRGDLTARIPEFIALAEARLNRVLRKRQAEIEVTLTTTPASRTVALPTTYTEALACWLSLSGSAERFGLTFADTISFDAYTVAGQPYYWTIDGVNLAFERPCDQAYSVILRCIESYALTDAAPTNTLLTDAPDVYLYATLCEAAPFLRDDAFGQAYEAKLSRAIAELNAKDARSKAQQRLPTEFGQLQRLSIRGSGYNIFSDRP